MHAAPATLLLLGPFTVAIHTLPGPALSQPPSLSPPLLSPFLTLQVWKVVNWRDVGRRYEQAIGQRMD